MEYYKYNECVNYYAAYNKNLSCQEYIIFLINIHPHVLLYKLEGKFHNIKGPSIIYFFPSGKKFREEFAIYDQFHNTKGPAVIQYSSIFDYPQIEEYWVEGTRHNSKGPAIIVRYSGNLIIEEYFVNGYKHNMSGPAFIYSRNKSIIKKEYWIYGVAMDTYRVFRLFLYIRNLFIK